MFVCINMFPTLFPTKDAVYCASEARLFFGDYMPHLLLESQITAGGIIYVYCARLALGCLVCV